MTIDECIHALLRDRREPDLDSISGHAHTKAIAERIEREFLS